MDAGTYLGPLFVHDAVSFCLKSEAQEKFVTMFLDVASRKVCFCKVSRVTSKAREELFDMSCLFFCKRKQ